MNKRFWLNLLGVFSLFFCVGFVVTCTVPLYGALENAYPGNVSIIAVALLANVVFICAFYAGIDKLRRIITVEKPVKKILNATEKIKSGDFAVEIEERAPYGRKDEFDRIIENINKMAKELSRSEMLKADFIANVSHELKTPSAVIINYAHLLKKEDLTDEERREYCDELIRSARRLSDTVTNILKLNKLENGSLEGEKESFNLGDLLGECILLYEDKIEQKNLELELDIEDIPCFAIKSYYQIVYGNLISNAVKFTPDGGKISISLKRSEKKATFYIKDTGCGFGEDVGRHIFERFYQADTSRAAEGNGLGLALVKRVIDVIGGEIFVESAPGEGSCFTVTTEIKEDE